MLQKTFEQVEAGGSCNAKSFTSSPLVSNFNFLSMCLKFVLLYLTLYSWRSWGSLVRFPRISSFSFCSSLSCRRKKDAMPSDVR